LPPWPITEIVVVGLLLVSYSIMALWVSNRDLRHKLNLKNIELAEAQAKIDVLNEFNKYCLDHASDVLAAWLDFKDERERD